VAVAEDDVDTTAPRVRVRVVYRLVADTIDLITHDGVHLPGVPFNCQRPVDGAVASAILDGALKGLREVAVARPSSPANSVAMNVPTETRQSANRST
jgi:hypothetical protein